jgi:hypothetical protein
VAVFDVLLHIHAKRRRPLKKSVRTFVEQINRGPLAPLNGGTRIHHRQGRFTNAGGSEQDCARAVTKPAHQTIELLRTAAECAFFDLDLPLRRQTRENNYASGLDIEIVIAGLKIHTAHLDDSYRMPLSSVFNRHVLKIENTVSDAFELAIGRLGGSIVQKQDRAFSCQEVLFESEYLAAESQRIAG